MNAVIPSDAVQAAWAALEALADPEIPIVSLRELGILRDVRQGADGLEVVITPTYSGCPAMGQIEDDVRTTLQAAGLQGRVITQLAPAWTTDWMTDAARDKLRAYGIAPPQHRCASQPPTGASPLRFVRQAARPERVPCPHCGSSHTVESSHFGSTACKALYKCLDCQEPFDYFKPY
jgi:ring-1,2-phenylacetyl-CoA epoxidase subunit PaaD